MSESKSRYVVAVVLAAIWQGMIGVWVKWIAFPPLPMVCLRCVFAACGLALYLLIRRQRLSLASSPHHEPGDLLPTSLGGILLAAHWGTLFWAYRLADVGPVVVAVFTYPVMAALMEPLAKKRAPQGRQILVALVACGGVSFMALSQRATSENNISGVILGLMSAACFALRGITTRQLVRRHDPTTIMFLQVSVVAVVLSPSLLLVPNEVVTPEAIGWLAVLGLAFTALPHSVTVWSLQRLTVASSGIIGSVQAVSGIVLAALLLGEQVPLAVWLGAGLVIAASIAESIRA